MLTPGATTRPISIFISCASEDEVLFQQLEKHLIFLQRQSLITLWHTLKIEPGLKKVLGMQKYLQQAQIILLLISPAYLASSECNEEMRLAAARDDMETVQIIPIHIRPTATWDTVPLSAHQSLPSNGKAISLWRSRDAAFTDIVREIRLIIEQHVQQQHVFPSNVPRLLAMPPPTDGHAILQREHVVQELHARLVQSGTNAIALSGMVGLGKSTVAALVYADVEKRRSRGEGPFTTQALWLKIHRNTTLMEIGQALSEVAGNTLSIDWNSLAPEDLAAELFSLLDAPAFPRLVVLDQFEELLDAQTGYALAERPGVSEWLHLLNSRPCTSRLLITCRFPPREIQEYPLAYFQTQPVDGLTVDEGVALLHAWGVQAREAELVFAVEHCRGHVQALLLLHALLKRDQGISIPDLFDDPAYIQLRTGDMAQKFLSYIYHQQLSQIQRELLLAFSVYREAVPLNATQLVMQQEGTRASTRQLVFAREVLLNQQLLLAVGKKRYELHPLVADFARDHFVENDELANEKARRHAHQQAALYYRSLSISTPIPREKRRNKSDIHDLIEAIWHQCCAGERVEAYASIMQEGFYTDLHRWGNNSILWEIYHLLLPPEPWQPDPVLAAQIYHEAGAISHFLGMKEMARQYYEQSVQLLRKLKQPQRLVEALNDLGALHRSSGSLEQAMAYYREAQHISDKASEEIVGKGTTLNNQGKVLVALGKQEQRQRQTKRAQSYYLQALALYKQALVLHQRMGVLGEEARTLNNSGEVCVELKRREEAETYYRQAFERFQEIGEHWGEGIVLNNLGVLYRRLGRDGEAQEYYGQALRIFREIRGREDEGTVLRSLGRLYLLHKKYDAALACFLLAKDTFEMLQLPEQGAIPEWVNTELLLSIGDQQFAGWRAGIEQHASQIVEKSLREGL